MEDAGAVEEDAAAAALKRWLLVVGTVAPREARKPCGPRCDAAAIEARLRLPLGLRLLPLLQLSSNELRSAA